MRCCCGLAVINLCTPCWCGNSCVSVLRTHFTSFPGATSAHKDNTTTNLINLLDGEKTPNIGYRNAKESIFMPIAIRRPGRDIRFFLFNASRCLNSSASGTKNIKEKITVLLRKKDRKERQRERDIERERLKLRKRERESCCPVA